MTGRKATFESLRSAFFAAFRDFLACVSAPPARGRAGGIFLSDTAREIDDSVADYDAVGRRLGSAVTGELSLFFSLPEAR